MGSFLQLGAKSLHRWCVVLLCSCLPESLISSNFFRSSSVAHESGQVLIGLGGDQTSFQRFRFKNCWSRRLENEPKKASTERDLSSLSLCVVVLSCASC